MVAGARTPWQQPLRPVAVAAGERPRSPAGGDGGPRGPRGQGSRRPWEPARPGPSRVTGLGSPIQRTMPGAALPEHGPPPAPAFIILHISAMTGLKGLLMGNVL